MEWSRQYGCDRQPTLDQMGEFVKDGQWEALNSFLQETYHIQPKFAFSKCSMQCGWNVKYQKSGKSLCVLYPMPGLFIALVVIGEKEMTEAEMMMPVCSGYIKKLFADTRFSLGGKWLMINVTNEQILSDVKNLILIRRKP